MILAAHIEKDGVKLGFFRVVPAIPSHIRSAHAGTSCHHSCSGLGDLRFSSVENKARSYSVFGILIICERVLKDKILSTPTISAKKREFAA